MHDYIVIGGGIVGLSTALQLTKRNTGASVLLIEKERELASHQTGRNSGVIHAGVYYRPGSLKARYCRMGQDETIAFCRQHGVRHEVTGKLLVATGELEVVRARALMDRCRENAIVHEWLDASELVRREPHVVGKAAIFVPSTAIVDYFAVAMKMAELFRQAGGEVALGEEVMDLREEPESVSIDTTSKTRTSRRLIVCAGLQSDRLAHMMGLGRGLKIIPFRGEYFRLRERWSGKFNHLVYPIPDPALPFLGIHLTKMIDGSVTAGPNAVLGLSREGYGKFDVNIRDLADMLAFGGFWRVMTANLRTGIQEFANSLSRQRYLQLCRKYCPALELEDLQPHPTGIRAQAVHSDGRLEHDFLVLSSARTIHVCNAPSPAATSALPIGRRIVDLAHERFAA